MTPQHDSMRGWFSAAMYEEMGANERIYLLTGDLGYGMLDQVRDQFPKRFLNVGASEQVLVGASVGLALGNAIPFCYSITPFILCRAFEWIRNYLHHERIPVKLIGSGMDDDYKHDGFTHHAFDARQILGCVPHVKTYFPESKEQIPGMVKDMCDNGQPCFMALRR